MELKEFEMADFDTIHQLFIGAFGHPLEKDLSKQKLIELLNSQTYNIYVAKENEKILGALVIYIHKDPFAPKDFATLWYFAVKSEFRGKGIGTFMLDKVCEILKEKNISSIRMTTANENYGCQKSAENSNFKKSLSYKRIL